ncbi:hypothetical protein L204_100415 [Cryptococcus depauperatus]
MCMASAGQQTPNIALRIIQIALRLYTIFGFVSITGFTSLFYHAVLSLQRVQSIHPVGTMLCFLPTSNYGVTCSGSQFLDGFWPDIYCRSLSPFQTNNLLRRPP